MVGILPIKMVTGGWCVYGIVLPTGPLVTSPNSFAEVANHAVELMMDPFG